MATALFTIGYERRELDEMIAILLANRVERVLDVRELPLSRRRGFSKTPLAAALEPAGIEYLHLREAGNPYRTEKDSIPRDELLAKYRTHLNRNRSVVGGVVEHVRDHRTALLCFEREPLECHRTILAARIARRLALVPTAL